MSEQQDIKTEEKIKNAALKLFYKNGFAGTKTRDIAEEAGINIALLNYYFRSKEKLFEIIMEESLQKMFTGVKNVFNKPSNIDEKIKSIVDNYIENLRINPNLPLFVLSAIQADATGFMKKTHLSKDFISPFFNQIKEELQTENALQIILNILALTIFPFIAKPLWLILSDMNDEQFTDFIEERRKLIPAWIKTML
ncbi:MAG: TetR family transcriptional regulator [Prevotellaceae bacterium]|jgi:AcrR family transcriptional regulator|nr:TetR family transcriptional regulator [Prevotellaceae bacterium]